MKTIVEFASRSARRIAAIFVISIFLCIVAFSSFNSFVSAGAEGIAASYSDYFSRKSPGSTFNDDERPEVTITVNSTAHGTDANPGTTTLVEAIQQANTLGGSNTIVLPTGGSFVSDDTVFIDNTSLGRTM